LVASQPGLINNGKAVNTHYNGYDLLRATEEALQLPTFGRFDTYAKPLNDVFVASSNGNKAASPPGPAATSRLQLSGTPTSATRGHIYDSFARVTTPVSADQGDNLELTVVGTGGPKQVQVVITPLGETPRPNSPRFSVGTNGQLLEIPTSGMSPGLYAAWLMEGPKLLPTQAALPVTIVPPGIIQASNPGVEIWSTLLPTPSTTTYQVRQSGNVFVRYCRPAGVPIDTTFIGIFADGTTTYSLSTVATGVVNFVPGNSPTDPCGYTWAHTRILNPGTIYHFIMVTATANGTFVPVGLTDTFTLTPVLPA
jgi:hypothetical protein